MEWQPIDTAPRDGTNILLFVCGSVIEGWWCEQWNDWEVVCLSSHVCGSIDDGTPTHWMPLPDPPAS